MARTGAGEEFILDHELILGDKSVLVETVNWISVLQEWTINQATNGAKKVGAVRLNITREPTAAEIAKLKAALGRRFSKVDILGTQDL